MIYNGPSIYNQGGGGGGGYNDGGALVDGDFIQVTNNSISTYDNTSRDPVNFYFEVSDGEMINSVIELTTAVNATINVYVVNNGLYYLLSNIGGNTVTAGDDYKVNITGDSYSIEQVSAPVDPLLYVFGVLVPIVKIGNKYWTAENAYSSFSGLVIGGPDNKTTPAAWWCKNTESTYGHNGTKYNLYYNSPASKYLDNNIGNGWRVPTKQDFIDLNNAVSGDIGKLTSFGGGTNETGFSCVASGNTANGSSWLNDGIAFALRYKFNGNNYGGFISSTGLGPLTFQDWNEDSTRFVPVRLCKDA